MSDQDPTQPVEDPYGDPTRADTPVSDPTMAMPVTQPSTPGGPPAEPPGPDEPTGEPPDRRPWVVIGLLIVILLAGLALLLGNDDDDDSSDTTSSTTTSSTTSTTTPTTTSTTTTAPPTTTTTAPPTTIDPARCVSSEPDDPDIAAGVVYDAYTVGDRDCASNLMTDEALDELFAIPGAGGGWGFQGCDEVPDPETDPTSCNYRFEGGSTTFTMQYDAGWVVYDVSQVAD